MADNYFERMKAYREWREAGHGEKVIYSPSAYPRKDIQKKYDELSKPTESERLQDELEPIVHPAMAPKRTTPRTLEEETEEWNFCMDEADHQTMVRREMARIRKEWKAKGLKEESVTDVHKIVHEAERRVSQMAKKDINKYKKDSHELIGGNDE